MHEHSGMPVTSSATSRLSADRLTTSTPNFADYDDHTAAPQTVASERNRSRTLWHLYRSEISSRAQIAKTLGLTPAAITKITARLIDEGIVSETGDMKGSKQRRSIGLTINTEEFHFIGVKFARSLVQIGVFDLKGTCLRLHDTPRISDNTIDVAIEATHREIDSLLASDPRIVAIGMAVPGPYLHGSGYSALVSAMPHWRNINFYEEFGQNCPVPVFIEQDARAGALAQRLFGALNDSRSLAYFLLGEGVGLGVIENSRLIYGNLGASTELGHVSIDAAAGTRCECGNVGCLECYCSAGAIHKQIDELGIIAHSTSMTHIEACQTLFSLAQTPDGPDARQARDLVEQIGRYVGYGCVIICNTFNPRNIVLGDIGALGGQQLLDAAQAVVTERVIPEIAQATTIILSGLPTDAAVLGAAATAITQFLDRPSLFRTSNMRKNTG
ncbi:putative NBD/HSP70 family sugar kinase [Bifidobacterium commune]|uniref:Sugar kinase of the NBD/HSP70 family, may contain an N-terminal HTH domain n=1 Tax=Bifidobacterium commune TaxID=1505727 RepID=A0A1C4H014_9BIFI|nr:ROK family transcriptional regulator [Bifidobacterium commune]MBB2955166.1 putative NBD/HSP70 family sugar kinase [Bifidobacterium commune]SCC78253.1 Sugar kinase of the NBD/HSP70 family, may contain an N-terminal HTH domain [Bifidobacterium commune]